MNDDEGFLPPEPPTRQTGLGRHAVDEPVLPPPVPLEELSWFQRGVRRVVLAIWSAVVRFFRNRDEELDVLSEPESWRDMVQALSGARTMTAVQRRALVLAVVLVMGSLWAAGSLLSFLLWPEVQDRFQRAFMLGFYSLATSLFLPTPYELVMVPSGVELGVWVAIFISAGAKAFGTFIVVSAGQTANVLIQRVLTRSATWTRGFNRIQRMAGHPLAYVFAFVMFVIPFNSDTLILYLLAPLGIRRLGLVGVTFVAFLVRGWLVFEASAWF